MLSLLLVGLLIINASASFVKVPRQAANDAPVTSLNYGSFRGKASGGINTFLGIPFAQPPVGRLRYRAPLPPLRTSKLIQNATSYGFACSQQRSTAGLGFNGISTDQAQAIAAQFGRAPSAPPSSVSDAEDCLTINVIAPSSCIASKANCPVLLWHYGGGFEFGDTSQYDGTPIVKRSMVTGTPIIYVSMNYRLNGFGFMGGKQIKDGLVGNLGLLDQQQAQRWVQTNIARFGGDPKKVTIWGESAGAISVALHMVTNKGQQGNLFRGAFMNSGSPIPTGAIDTARSQAVFDFVSSEVGCRDENKTLDCMRLVPYLSLKAAIDKTPAILSYQSLALSYLPQADGVFLTDRPQHLVSKGQYSRVPMVTGDMNDEGTLFSVTSVNVTTEEQARKYLRETYAPKATDAEVEQLATLYPQDPNVGSPYDTQFRNQLTPQFKRLASFAGDLVFQGPRRYFLSFTSKTQPSWAFIFKRGTNNPFLGAFHGFDLVSQFYPNPDIGLNCDGIDYLVNFVDHLNPNPRPATTNPNLIFWPKYGTQKNLLTFLDLPPFSASSLSLVPLSITIDDFRKAPMNFLTRLALKYPL